MPPGLGGHLSNMNFFRNNEGRWIATYSTDECFLSNAEIERIKQHIDTRPIPERVIFHDPATIVYWQDGTKTVVKCMDGQPYNEYYGFLAALAKKVYGTSSAVERIIRKYHKEDE